MRRPGSGLRVGANRVGHHESVNTFAFFCALRLLIEILTYDTKKELVRVFEYNRAVIAILCCTVLIEI